MRSFKGLALTSQSPALLVSLRHTCCAGQAPAVFAIFLIAQVLDGGLTYWGVQRLGVGVEGNALLATAMHAFGAVPALLGAKTLACVCGFVLHVNEWYRSLAVVAGTCLGVGVFPWLLVLTVVS